MGGLILNHENRSRQEEKPSFFSPSVLFRRLHGEPVFLVFSKLSGGYEDQASSSRHLKICAHLMELCAKFPGILSTRFWFASEIGRLKTCDRDQA